MPVPNPEQTASIFSLGFFFFLDPVVFEAYRVPHLPYDRLPPLADDDSIKNLKAAHFKVRELVRKFVLQNLIFRSTLTHSRELNPETMYSTSYGRSLQ